MNDMGLKQPVWENDGLPWYDRRSRIPCPVARPDILIEQLDDEAVLFDPRNGSTYRLNHTSLLVWRFCRPGSCIQNIVRSISEHYDIDHERLLEDVEQVLAYLASHGLVNPANDSLPED